MIEELENKINILSVQNEKLKAENEYLRERCKNEYEGFIAITNELCDLSRELNRYKKRIDKAIEYIKTRVDSSKASKYELLSILNGGDEDERI